MTDLKISPLDIAAIRADFPALNQDVHPGKPLIFLDSAASSQKPRLVIQTQYDKQNTDPISTDVKTQ